MASKMRSGNGQRKYHQKEPEAPEEKYLTRWGTESLGRFGPGTGRNTVGTETQTLKGD